MPNLKGLVKFPDNDEKIAAWSLILLYVLVCITCNTKELKENAVAAGDGGENSATASATTPQNSRTVLFRLDTGS